MKLSEQGIAMIKGFEGCVLKAYRCPANVLTIGYGHTGPDVTKGLLWTQQQADEAFLADVERFERLVDTSLPPGDLCRLGPSDGTQARFDALVSLTFNIGPGLPPEHPKGPSGYLGSTLLRRLRAKDLMGAAEQFTVWNKAGGAFNKGLLQRRTREMRIFLVGY